MGIRLVCLRQKEVQCDWSTKGGERQGYTGGEGRVWLIHTGL